MPDFIFLVMSVLEKMNPARTGRSLCHLPPAATKKVQTTREDLPKKLTISTAAGLFVFDRACNVIHNPKK